MKEVLRNLKLNNSYNDRQKEIEEYLNKSKAYKSLNLTVASSSLHFPKTIFSITPNGLIEKDSKIIKDGIMLFGYEANSHIEEEIGEENISIQVYMILFFLLKMKIRYIYVNFQVFAYILIQKMKIII